MTKKILHLHLRFRWFDDILDGTKPFEFRVDNEYWRKKLKNDYDEVWFYRGYQKAVEGKTLLKRRHLKTGIMRLPVQSDEFGPDPVICFAIPTHAELP